MRRLAYSLLPCLLVLPLIFAGGCGGGSGSGGGATTAMDYSGTYQSTAHKSDGDPVSTGTLVITQEGGNVTCIVTDEAEGGDFTWQGTVSGNTMTLRRVSGDGGPTLVVIGFSDDGQSFSGTWEGDGESGTITGTKIS